MKRKILTVLLICVVALCGMPSTAVAATPEIEPYFNVISSADSAIGLSVGNKLAYEVCVYAPKSTSLDTVHISAELRTSGGALIKTYNQNMIKNGNEFYFNDSHYITKTGVYFLRFTVKCYKSGVLVDQFTENSRTVPYVA